VTGLVVSIFRAQSGGEGNSESPSVRCKCQRQKSRRNAGRAVNK
jgi:hypothetical protein